MARGVCQSRSTMLKLVTFVQLVLYWYNGFSQSVVMESDLFLRVSMWENGATCHNIVRRQIASTLKKGDCSLRHTCCGNTTTTFFFFFLKMPDCHPQISIWLKREKKISTPRAQSHIDTHTETNILQHPFLFGCCSRQFTT